MADTLEELHRFAQSIGLRRKWFQDHRHPHYDLMGGMRQKALEAGAVLVSSRELVTEPAPAEGVTIPE